MKPALIQPFSALSNCARAFPRNRVDELLSIWGAICEGIFACVDTGLRHGKSGVSLRW
jgi:hypothetical protein